MTSIVVFEGKLYGDRKLSSFGSPMSFSDGTKIHISKDKQFAYGIAGYILEPQNKPKMEALLRKCLEHMVASGKDGAKVADILEGTKEIDMFSSGVIITRDQQWMTHYGGENLRKLDGQPHGMGTGGIYMVSMLRCGMSVTEAAKATSVLDYLSGDKYDIIDSQKLKPFVIQGAAK